MAETCDILIFGTGSFAARILFDIAATAAKPVKVIVAGRRADRLAWLRTAGHARAAMFGRPVRIDTDTVAVDGPEQAAQAIKRHRPSVIAQIASAQGGAVIAAKGNAWAKIVAEGGLSATAVFQALLSRRVAAGLLQSGHTAHMINCCYADVTNSMIAAEGLPITSGIGNVSILSNAFAGELGPGGPQMRVLAHYQTIGIFRRLPDDREGPVPRVWLGAEEMADVRKTFRRVQLTPEPVIDVSGASGVPLMLALASGDSWTGHAPGPHGLPGGYPVRVSGGKLDLDLPPGMTRDEAVRWNAKFEEENGLVVDRNGRARYTGVLHDCFARYSRELAAGFAVGDLETVCKDMSALRDRLLATAA